MRCTTPFTIGLTIGGAILVAGVAASVAFAGFEQNPLTAVDTIPSQYQFGSNGTGVRDMLSSSGLVVDAQNQVYVADCALDRVQVFSPAGDFVRSLGPGQEKLSCPRGLAAARDGRLLVVDSGNRRVVAFDPVGKSLAARYLRRRHPVADEEYVGPVHSTDAVVRGTLVLGFPRLLGALLLLAPSTPVTPFVLNDDALEPVAHQVSTIRGSSPVSAVPVDFLDRDALNDSLRKSVERTYPEDERLAREQVLVFLQLLDPGQDQLDVVQALLPDQVLGTYDEQDKRIHLLGPEDTRSARANDFRA